VQGPQGPREEVQNDLEHFFARSSRHGESGGESRGLEFRLLSQNTTVFLEATRLQEVSESLGQNTQRIVEVLMELLVIAEMGEVSRSVIVCPSQKYGQANENAALTKSSLHALME